MQVDKEVSVGCVDRTLVWRGRRLDSSVVARLPLPPPDRTPPPELLPRADLSVPAWPDYEPRDTDSDGVPGEIKMAASEEIDLGDLSVEDEFEDLLALSESWPAPEVDAPMRGWLRRVLVGGAFLLTFWLADAGLTPWLN